MFLPQHCACVAVPADEDEPLTPTHHNGTAAGDTDEEQGAAAAAVAAAAGEAAAGSPDVHGSSFAMRGASAMKQIRAPLEALFKRRGSTTPGSFTQGVPPAAAGAGGEGSTLSAGGALPAGLEARRMALLATLQGGGGGLPAGKYVVEVDSSGELSGVLM